MEIVRRASLLMLALGLASGWSLPSHVRADDPPALPAAESLLPRTTQGVVQIVNSPDMREHWNLTQLSKLATDEALKPFWDAQQEEIEKRLFDAGWQLNVNFADLRDIATGQIALGWIERATDLRKPYALALIVDVAQKEDAAAELLKKIDKQLRSRQAKVATQTHAGQSIQHYTMPRKPGELLLQETFYAIVDRQLVSTDDLTTLTNIIDARLAGSPAKVLSGDPVFQKAIDRLQSVEKAQIQYFVRPLGFAKVVRAIGGRREIGKTDIIAVLERQGFNEIQAAVGQIQFGTDELDMVHRGFVLTVPDRSRTVQVLDFPNSEARDIPDWINPNSASFLTVNWNAQEAFWKVEGLVDDMSGQEGVFRSVIDGIRDDIHGAQIDIEKDVLPYLTNEIIVLNDTVEPITPDSRRTMVAIKLKDSAKIRLAIDNAMEKEAAAEPIDFDGLKVWLVTHADDEDVQFDAPDFGDFGGLSPSKEKKGSDEADGYKEDEPLLKNWSITVDGGYLLFASHIEMIEEATTRRKASSLDETLVEQSDFDRTLQMIDKLRAGQALAAWRVLRTDKSFRMQYELFRADELPQSRSMWATLLDRLLKPKEEVKVKEQKVKGDLLPQFDSVSKYLLPSGMGITTQDDGWSYFSFLLAPEVGLQAAKSAADNTTK